MAHSSHHGSGSKDAALRSSTLYNETGNIRLYRVSEETRKKVAEESKRIHDEMVKHNNQSRRRFREEENQKFRTRERFRIAMLNRWVEKYKDSPFSVDLYEKEMKRKMKHDDFVHQKKVYEDKVRLVASMKGEDDNIYGKTARDKMGFKYHTKMALQYQQYILDDQLIRRDNKLLDQMLYEELDVVAEKFPYVAGKSMQLSSADGRDEPHGFVNSDYPQSASPDAEDLSQESEYLRNPYFQDGNKRRNHDNYDRQIPSGSVSTGFSGPLDYSSPEIRMKALEDDLSEKFSETQFL